MVRLGITGTPGTGKTSVSSELSRITGWKVVHVNDIALEFSIDVYKDSSVIDVERLEEKLRNIDGNVIFESHLLCEMKLNLDYMIVLRCNPIELKRRLALKGWDSDKIKTNVEAEYLDYCLIKSERNYPRVFQVDTTNLTPKEVAVKILDIIKGGKDDDVDWSDQLFKSL